MGLNWNWLGTFPGTDIIRFELYEEYGGISREEYSKLCKEEIFKL